MNASMSEGRLPNFLVIGAMKCGTTSLAYHLRRHPQVFLPRIKELHYFNGRRDVGLDWYRQQFEGSEGYLAAGEATPAYMHELHAIDEMAEVIPDARLVAILRNPIDRAYSHYWHECTRGRESLSFEAALDAEPQRLLERTGADNVQAAYVDQGRYLPRLRYVTKHFPRESLHVMILEDFEARPKEEFSELCEFIGVDPALMPDGLDRPVNEYFRVRSLRFRNMTKRFPKKLRDGLGRFNRIDADYVPMNPATRARLRDEFRGGNDALAEFLGRDLSAWES
jgi:sulfotransferase family protein